MKVRLLFFAGLREQLGTSGEDLELPADVTSLSALRAHLRTRGPAWQAALAEGRVLRTAVNQSLVSKDAPVADGDEIAFFPPVTGG